SMATPHVSGAAALLLSACALNTAALKTALLNTVDLIPSLAGKTITGGRLNDARALASCPVPPAPALFSPATAASRTVTQGNGTSYTVSTTSIGGFAGTLTLSVTGLPIDAVPTFTPASVAAGGSSTLSVTTASTTPTGSFPLTISATDGTTT